MELSEDGDDDDDDDDDDDVRRISSSWVHVNSLTTDTQQLTSAIVDFSCLSVLCVDRRTNHRLRNCSWFQRCTEI